MQTGSLQQSCVELSPVVNVDCAKNDLFFFATNFKSMRRFTTVTMSESGCGSPNLVFQSANVVKLTSNSIVERLENFALIDVQ